MAVDPPDDIDLSAFNPEQLAEASQRRARDRVAKRRRSQWVVVDGGQDGNRDGEVAPADDAGRTKRE